MLPIMLTSTTHGELICAPFLLDEETVRGSAILLISLEDDDYCDAHDLSSSSSSSSTSIIEIPSKSSSPKQPRQQPRSCSPRSSVPVSCLVALALLSLQHCSTWVTDVIFFSRLSVVTALRPIRYQSLRTERELPLW
jgi:hypothetical protein